MTGFDDFAPDPMTEDTFQDLLDRFGGRLEVWPEPNRAAALALLDRSEPARGMLATAKALSATLDTVDVPRAGDLLHRRILMQPPLGGGAVSGTTRQGRFHGLTRIVATVALTVVTFAAGYWAGNGNHLGPAPLTVAATAPAPAVDLVTEPMAPDVAPVTVLASAPAAPDAYPETTLAELLQQDLDEDSTSAGTDGSFLIGLPLQ